MKNPEGIEAVDRRGFMAYMSALGLGGTLLPGVLWAQLQERGEITSEILEDAVAVSGLDFTEEERDLMVAGLTRNLEAYEELREFPISNHVTPAVQFDPASAQLRQSVLNVFKDAIPHVRANENHVGMN